MKGVDSSCSKKYKVIFEATVEDELLFEEIMKYLFDVMISFKADYVKQGHSTLEFECDSDLKGRLKKLGYRVHEVHC